MIELDYAYMLNKRPRVYMQCIRIFRILHYFYGIYIYVLLTLLYFFEMMMELTHLGALLMLVKQFQ